MTAYVCPEGKSDCVNDCYHARIHPHTIECDRPCLAYKSDKCVEVSE